MKIENEQLRKSLKIDLNSILKFLNVLILFSLWYTYNENGGNEYIDRNTILLGSLLNLQILLFLFLEQKKRDPFVILLCLQMVIYFCFRILTLTIYPFSFAFQRYPFTSKDLNFAIVFILFANTALFLGLKSVQIKHKIDVEETTLVKSNNNVIYVLVITYFLTFSRTLGISGLTMLIDILTSIFVNLNVLFLMMIVYLVLFYDKLKKRIRNIILGGILMMVLLLTLTGSRSAILTQINLLIFTSLAIYKTIKVKLSYLISFIILIPFMVVLFLVATYLRPRLENRAALGSETFALVNEFNLVETFQDNSKVVLAPVFDRIGFLDYCAETIANSEKYESVFNFKFYFKSIIDNVITPGFDVFDTPKIANAITFIYNDIGQPAKSKVSEAYQSDEFTLYGEVYAFFGYWLSLVVIFISGYSFKRLYTNLNSKDAFNIYVKRAFILFVFYSLLNSFGFDWVLLDIVGIYFTFNIFKYFFKIKPASIAINKF